MDTNKNIPDSEAELIGKSKLFLCEKGVNYYIYRDEASGGFFFWTGETAEDLRLITRMYLNDGDGIPETVWEQDRLLESFERELEVHADWDPCSCYDSGRGCGSGCCSPGIDVVLEVLNGALALDPIAVETLCETRVAVAEAMADHPSVVVAGEVGKSLLGPLGLLNGVIEPLTGHKICGVYELNEEGHSKLVRFDKANKED